MQPRIGGAICGGNGGHFGGRWASVMAVFGDAGLAPVESDGQKDSDED